MGGKKRLKPETWIEPNEQTFLRFQTHVNKEYQQKGRYGQCKNKAEKIRRFYFFVTVFPCYTGNKLKYEPKSEVSNNVWILHCVTMYFAHILSFMWLLCCLKHNLLTERWQKVLWVEGRAIWKPNFLVCLMWGCGGDNKVATPLVRCL